MCRLPACPLSAGDGLTLCDGTIMYVNGAAQGIAVSAAQRRQRSCLVPRAGEAEGLLYGGLAGAQPRNLPSLPL